MHLYKINESFTVMPQSNLINELKLEPRLMKLLCLLVANPGNLITREEIIEKIWQGYGGGDEGLTQAISFLRKILNDTTRTIIETVPKSGYIFHGKIEMLPVVDTAQLTSPPSGGTSHINVNTIILISVAILVICILIFFKPASNSTPGIAPRADTSVTPAPSYEVAPQAK